MSIKGMIETNKKWLEDLKKDSTVYPLVGSGLSLHSSFLQQEVSESGALQQFQSLNL